jgi:hypothetical protein
MINGSKYDLVDADQAESTGSANFCYLEDGRLVFNRNIGTGSIISYPYYRFHEEVTTDSQVLELDSRYAKSVLIAGMSAKFAELDTSITSQETMTWYSKFQSLIAKTIFYLDNYRQKGRRFKINDKNDNMFNVS